MSDYNDFMKGLAKARVDADNKAMQEAWDELAFSIRSPDVAELAKKMFEVGWGRGVIYGVQNPIK